MHPYGKMAPSNLHSGLEAKTMIIANETIVDQIEWIKISLISPIPIKKYATNGTSSDVTPFLVKYLHIQLQQGMHTLF
jgi:hypothetical protein